MDHLLDGLDGSDMRQSTEMLHLGHVIGHHFTPCDTVTDRPRVDSIDEEIRPRHACDRVMESLANRHDVAPPPGEVRAFEERDGEPAIDRGPEES